MERGRRIALWFQKGCSEAELESKWLEVVPYRMEL